MSRYCLVVNGSNYYSPFDHLGLELTSNVNILIRSPEQIALVVFTGGEDISPSLYGHDNVASYTSPVRDEIEVKLFNIALSNGIPMAGICRGAQFLCAMAGGKIIQDVSGHGMRHRLQFKNGDKYETSPETVTSTHHQMQYPWSIDREMFDILAFSPEPISRHYQLGNDIISAGNASAQLNIEPDVVFYRNINALAIQYHPEYMPRDSWGFRYAQEVVAEKLGNLIEERVEANESLA